MKRLFSLIAFALLFFSSCKSSENQDKLLPAISGTAGEIEVVCNKSDWEAEPGNAIREVLAQECPYLPQVEPLYTLFNVPPTSFSKIFKVHRNIVWLNIGEGYPEAKMVLNKDVWADPQTVVRFEGPTPNAVSDLIYNESDNLISIFEQAERDRIIASSKEFEITNIRSAVEKFAGGSPVFPTGYSIKKITSNFMWISNETTFTNQSILVYIYPYTSPNDLTAAALAEKRNEITRENIPCTTENSYVIINPMIEPGFKFMKYKTREFIEMRGLWDAYNDFMGGPYVSHTYVNYDTNEIIVFDAFVYAPKYPKRNYLRQVESILYSFEWAEK
jgi:hypothetical protein